MFLVNSCLGHLSAAWIAPRLPLLRTYGVNLPSSLTTLLPIVLGFSPHLPVSVCGTGNRSLLSGFSRQCGISSFNRNWSPHQSFETGYVLHYIPIYLPCPGLSSYRVCLSSCVPASFKRFRSVQESQPAVHRLRLSASA